MRLGPLFKFFELKEHIWNIVIYRYHVIDVVTARVEFLIIFYEVQFAHAFFHREQDPKTKIQSTLFIIFNLFVGDCCIFLHKIKSAIQRLKMTITYLAFWSKDPYPKLQERSSVL